MDRRKFLESLSLPAFSLLPLPQSRIFTSTDRKVVVGIDATGPNPADGHRLIEIAAVEIIGRHISGASFRSYLNPEWDFATRGPLLDGLTQEDLDDKPFFSSIAHELAEFLGSDTLILYGAPHHLAFLKHEFSIAGHEFAPARAVIDAYELANWDKFSDDFVGNFFTPIDPEPDDNSLAFSEVIWVARLYLGMTA